MDFGMALRFGDAWRAKMGRKVVGIVVVSGFVAFGASAWAHHSMVAYEQKETTTIEGVVTAVKWRNPHMLVELAVPTADGKTETWVFEGGPVNAAVNAGITPTLLKVGTKIKITGRRHLDPAVHMALLNQVEVDGKVYARGGG